MAAPQALKVNLTSLSPREAIADALYRCTLGIDSNNRPLFESAFLKNETMTMTFGSTTLNGWDAVNKFFQIVFDVTTTHITSNIRIDLKSEDADTAFMTANAIAYHMKTEEAFEREDRSYTAGNLYFMELVRDKGDGLWKIGKWEIRTLWTTGVRAVLYG